MKQPSIAGLFDVPLRQVPQVRSGDKTHAADSEVSRSSVSPSTPRQREMRRLGDNAMRVLNLLKLRGELGATNVELCDPAIGGLRAVGRVHELRSDGWRITKQHEHGGVWRYVLRGLRS